MQLPLIARETTKGFWTIEQQQLMRVHCEFGSFGSLDSLLCF